VIKTWLVGAALVVCCGIAQVAECAALVREEKIIVVNGHKETWQLRWLHAPKPSPYCSPMGESFENNCLCAGFAYGESGKLEVTRRVGKKTERLLLDQFGRAGDYDSQGPDTVLRKWEPQSDDPSDDTNPEAVAKLIASLKRRPESDVLALGDYVHDGVGRQFLFQVGQMTCGKRMSILVGVTAQNPHLHAIKPAPGAIEPIVAEERAWQALLAGGGASTTTFWLCGDHGSEQETELLLVAHGGFVTGTTRSYACGKDGQRGNPVGSGSWPQ